MQWSVGCMTRTYCHSRAEGKAGAVSRSVEAPNADEIRSVPTRLSDRRKFTESGRAALVGTLTQ